MPGEAHGAAGWFPPCIWLPDGCNGREGRAARGVAEGAVCACCCHAPAPSPLPWANLSCAPDTPPCNCFCVPALPAVPLPSDTPPCACAPSQPSVAPLTLLPAPFCTLHPLAVNGPTTADGRLPPFEWKGEMAQGVQHIGQPRKFDYDFELMTPDDSHWGAGGAAQ